MEALCHEGQAGLTSPRPRELSERVVARATALPGEWWGQRGARARPSEEQLEKPLFRFEEQKSIEMT